MRSLFILLLAACGPRSESSRGTIDQNKPPVTFEGPHFAMPGYRECETATEVNGFRFRISQVEKMEGERAATTELHVYFPPLIQNDPHVVNPKQHHDEARIYLGVYDDNGDRTWDRTSFTYNSRFYRDPVEYNELLLAAEHAASRCWPSN